MSLETELRKALYAEYFKKPVKIDRNKVNLMIDELFYLDKDASAPIQKITYNSHDSGEPSHIIRIAPPKRKPVPAAVLAAVAATIVSFIIVSLSNTSQADQQHGFFWWMNKDHDGTSMLTYPSDKRETIEMDLYGYELHYSIDGSPFMIGMTQKFDMDTKYRFYYFRNYDNVQVNVYRSSNLLFLWEYNGRDYYVITDTYKDFIWNVIKDHIDVVKQYT